MEKEAIIKSFKKFSTPTIYEAAGKLGEMDPNIRPVVIGSKITGPAFTVKCLPGDNKAALKAIDLAEAGDIIVIEMAGAENVTSWGGTSSLAAKIRKLGGCVTNAAVRDVDEIVKIKFPVYSKGVSVRGTVKFHPGWLNVTVSVGGITVNPGDLIIGDSDGVVVVPLQKVEEVLKKAPLQKSKEEEIEKRLCSGERITDIFDITN